MYCIHKSQGQLNARSTWNSPYKLLNYNENRYNESGSGSWITLEIHLDLDLNVLPTYRKWIKLLSKKELKNKLGSVSKINISLRENFLPPGSGSSKRIREQATVFYNNGSRQIHWEQLWNPIQDTITQNQLCPKYFLGKKHDRKAPPKPGHGRILQQLCGKHANYYRHRAE